MFLQPPSESRGGQFSCPLKSPNMAPRPTVLYCCVELSFFFLLLNYYFYSLRAFDFFGELQTIKVIKIIKIIGFDLFWFHLKDVGLPLTVDAGERSINGPADAPHILNELWITREHCLLVKFKEVLPWKTKPERSCCFICYFQT